MARELSDDVRWMGDTLGAVLRAQAGPRIFDAVEALRGAARRGREAGDAASRAKAHAALARGAAALAADDAAEVTRAFALWFQLVNVAEDVHRVRELRRRERAGGPEAVPESLAAVLAERARRGDGADAVRETLGGLELRFVFTAHPTEARRRTTERLLAGVRTQAGDRARSAWTPGERREGEASVRAAVEALWQHAPRRPRPPEVLEEVEGGLGYLRDVLLDVVPALHRRLHAAFEDRLGPVDALALPVPVSFGSWMGSDRDGNPHVGVETTERTLALQRDIVLDRYAEDLDGLADPLAAARERLPPGGALAERTSAAAEALPEVWEESGRRNPGEPLRRLLAVLRARVQRAREGRAGGYPGPEALLEDLHGLRRILQASGATALADGALRDLVIRVRAFGFHLASLDVREDAREHAAVVAELLGDPDHASRDAEVRVAALETLRLPGSDEALSPRARRLLALFASLGDQQARYGEAALHTYAISHCESPADLLTLFRLAELHGLAGRLDLVPLLESRSALEAAEPLLARAFAHGRYRAHLARRGGIQEVLFGYSDSMKESGILASRVAVRHALCGAAEACRAAALELRAFHGRGGSVSRGGGPTGRALRALPAAAWTGRIKITEQGEVRSFRFGHPALSLRYLEQTLGAALERRHEVAAGSAADAADAPRGARLLDDMAAAAERAYRARVGDPATLRFFRRATPFEAIAALNIGSRPASRGEDPADLEALRAIPWVFAWSQCRVVLTGWYGVGTALAAAAEAHGEGALRRLHEGSRFFRDLLDNVQMSLAKTDLDVAAHYAQRAPDPEEARRVLEAVRAEHDRTRRLLLRTRGQHELLEDDPVLQASIRLRNPYVDPLSHLQVEALARRREGGGDAEAWERVARLSVQGIAAGLRNTG